MLVVDVLGIRDLHVPVLSLPLPTTECQEQSRHQAFAMRMRCTLHTAHCTLHCQPISRQTSSFHTVAWMMMTHAVVSESPCHIPICKWCDRDTQNDWKRHCSPKAAQGLGHSLHPCLGARVGGKSDSSASNLLLSCRGCLARSPEVCNVNIRRQRSCLSHGHPFAVEPFGTLELTELTVPLELTSPCQNARGLS